MNNPASTHTTYSTTGSAESLLMFRPEVRRLLGVSDSTLYEWSATGIFLKPFSLGCPRSDGRARRAAWYREDVMNWIREQATQTA
ncbi:Helix-turn-helix domain protein [compost metagenome]